MTPDRAAAGRRLRRDFRLLTALRWLPTGLLVPVLVLLPIARGFDLATIGALAAARSLVVIVLELPTGGLADVVGRRAVLVTAGGALAVAAGVGAVATTAGGLAVAAVAGGVGRALGSGPLEAWFVDALGEEGEGRNLTGSEGDGLDGSDALSVGAPGAPAGGLVGGLEPPDALTQGLAVGQSAEAIGLGVGVVAGAALAVPSWGLPARGDAALLGLSVPMVAGAIGCLVWTALVVVLVRPPATAEPAPMTAPVAAGPPSGTAGGARRRGLGAATGASLRQAALGARRAARSADLRRLLARTATMGVALVSVELFGPPLVADRVGDQERGAAVFGLLAAAAFAATAAGALLGPRVGRRLGSPAAAVVATSLAAGAALLGFAVPAVVAVGVAYLLAYALLGASGPPASTLLHRRVAASDRATLLSVDSLALQAGGMAAALALPFVASRSPSAVWAVTAVVLVAGAIAVWPLREAAPTAPVPGPRDPGRAEAAPPGGKRRLGGDGRRR